ncbi:MAG: hypothetical protein ACXAEF_01200 [Candidatus Thorarchaeota archaeon]|jgi:hypothetical protein
MSSKNRTIYEKTTHIVVRNRLRMQYPRPNTRKIKFSVFLIVLLALPLVSLHSAFNTPLHHPELSRNLQTSAETPSLILTYYSRLNSTPTPLESGLKISGDHVVLNATWVPEDNVNGTLIQVYAAAIPNLIEAESTQNTVEIDTRALGNNAECAVNVTTWLLNGTVLSEVFTEVFIWNFFQPHVEVLTPNGGETWTSEHNITWIAWDNNTDDTLSFEILLSSDGGTSFQLLSAQVVNHWFVWDFSGFLSHTEYLVEVRASDGIYTTSDQSDAVFQAGGIIPTATTTNPTSSVDTTPAADALDMRLGIFVSAAIIASAFLSLIVYQQAKRLS